MTQRERAGAVGAVNPRVGADRIVLAYRAAPRIHRAHNAFVALRTDGALSVEGSLGTAPRRPTVSATSPTRCDARGAIPARPPRRALMLLMPAECAGPGWALCAPRLAAPRPSTTRPGRLRRASAGHARPADAEVHSKADAKADAPSRLAPSPAAPGAHSQLSLRTPTARATISNDTDIIDPMTAT